MAARTGSWIHAMVASKMAWSTPSRKPATRAGSAGANWIGSESNVRASPCSKPVAVVGGGVCSLGHAPARSRGGRRGATS
eukprot:186247-Prymnesium_polylepis.1